MAKVYSQNMPIVWQLTASPLAANGNITASSLTLGYARMVGVFTSDVATSTCVGFKIEMSADGGSHWDHVSASDAYGASVAATCSVELLGNAVKITACNGATAASTIRAFFQLRPI